MGKPFHIVRKLVDKQLPFELGLIKRIEFPEKTTSTTLLEFRKEMLPAIKYQADKRNLDLEIKMGSVFEVISIKDEKLTVNPANILEQLQTTFPLESPAVEK